MKWIARFFLTIGLVLPSALAHAADAVGTVVGISGPCKTQTRSLKPGGTVNVGDTIDVPSGAKLKLRMADQSVISFASGTRLAVANYDIGPTSRHVKLIMPRGLLRLTIPEIAGESSFEVSTEAGSAAMRSASGNWFIDFESGVAQLATLSGNVTLTGTATKRSVSVPTRWGTRLQEGFDPVLPRSWGQVEFDGFIRRTECCGAPAKVEPPVQIK
jgi:FecR protein